MRYTAEDRLTECQHQTSRRQECLLLSFRDLQIQLRCLFVVALGLRSFGSLVKLLGFWEKRFRVLIPVVWLLLTLLNGPDA
jgi:hypothetical protein